MAKAWSGVLVVEFIMLAVILEYSLNTWIANLKIYCHTGVGGYPEVFNKTIR